MCFSVNVNLVKDELENRYGASFPDRDRYQPSYYYHAFSLPEIPALCSGNPSNFQLLKWGLIPSWTRTIEDAEEIRYKTFNARAESVNSKPSFSKPFRSKRCIIPVKGFFEWQHTDQGKIPWYIYHADDEIFSIAGIYDTWVESSTGEVFNTFSLITAEANELLAEIHNSKKRMPVILDRADENLWINLMTNEQDALSLLIPCPSGILKAHTISNLVNSKTAIRNTPDVIRPFDRKQGQADGNLF
jgi:putative SOS response-associated peptidase YedK